VADRTTAAADQTTVADQTPAADQATAADRTTAAAAALQVLPAPTLAAARISTAASAVLVGDCTGTRTG